MPSKQIIIVAVLSIMMVMSAGCAGWGTDGPTNPDEETDGNGGAEAEEDSENEESDRAEDEGTETPDNTSSTSEGDTGTQDSPESSDTTSDTSPSDESGSDESTDETGETKNGDSQQPSKKDSDRSDTDSDKEDSNSDDAQDPSDDDEERPYGLTATVVDPDGAPVEGMGVELFTYPDGEHIATGTTNEQGKITFEVEEGDYELVANVEDSPYTDYGTHPVEVTDDTEYEILLSHPPDNGEETHTLTVEVYDSEGESVEGANVSLAVYDTGEPVADRVTDENGQAHFEVPDGSYEVLVNDVEDAQSTLDMGTSVQGEDTTHIVNLYDPNDDMHLYQANVQVVDEDGNPIPNELVQVASPPGEEPQHLITDENGEVTIQFGNSSLDDVVEHEVIVRGESHYIHVDRGVQYETITATEERETYELTVHAGEVYPVEGVDVTVERWDGQMITKTTGEDGTASFEVYPGKYTVSGEYQDQSDERDVLVEDDRGIALSIDKPAPDTVETTLEVVDTEENPVEGVEVEAMTSIPPAGADVYIQSKPTDENGEVVVEAHAGQNYSIDRVVDQQGNSYQVVDGGTGFTMHVDEDGNSEPIVVERPEEDQQQAVAVAA